MEPEKQDLTHGEFRQEFKNAGLKPGTYTSGERAEGPKIKTPRQSRGVDLYEEKSTTPAMHLSSKIRGKDTLSVSRWIAGR